MQQMSSVGELGNNLIFEDLIEDFDPSLTDIGSLNTVHDRYQFESKFDFDLKSASHGMQKQYDLDVYFFRNLC